MKKFIELTGLDDCNNMINIFVNAEKIAYMCEIDGKCNENSSLSTLIYLEGNTSVSVIENVFDITEIINDTRFIREHA